MRSRHPNETSRKYSVYVNIMPQLSDFFVGPSGLSDSVVISPAPKRRERPIFSINSDSLDFQKGRRGRYLLKTRAQVDGSCLLSRLPTR
jgi:hypothetical protein